MRSRVSEGGHTLCVVSSYLTHLFQLTTVGGVTMCVVSSDLRLYVCHTVRTIKGPHTLRRGSGWSTIQDSYAALGACGMCEQGV